MNNIFNTFLAGWCADAVGARLEFKKQKFTEQEAIDAMHFVGEKTTGIPEGQFTDDSEMELCLLQALIDGKNDDFFPIERIAQEYINWYKSNPFDMGITTRYALLNANNATDMVNNAFNYNEKSESNGSLMRCVPIAVFCINKPYDVILELASSDASLTHYSNRVHLITGIYCCLISKILYLNKTNTIINVNILLEDINKLAVNDIVVKEWINIGIKLTNLDGYDCIKNEGHIKHAFILVIYFLKNINNFTYEKALIEVFKCGGDTDTNGKIVGNLFGAYYSNCVPEYISNVVLNFDSSKNTYKYFKRPSNYSIKHGIELLKNIV
jgi:ADP-ribosyl-[dinitrogen reductase] hydrolase